MTRENQILIELLNGVTTWGELKPRLEQFNTSATDTTTKKTTAGKIFEYFTKYFLQTDPRHFDQYQDVWLYNDIPSEISKALALPPVDHGIDILLKDFEGKYYAVQCKFTNDETKVLSWRGDKIAHVFGLGTLCDKIVVFTNASDTAQVAKDFTNKFIQIAFEELDGIQPDVFVAILERAKGNQPPELQKHKPEPHQTKAIEDVLNHFKDNPTYSRTQLILPCGAGKTMTALWLKENLQAKNTLVLVPSLALLKQIKNDWARHKNAFFRYLCVCSEKDIDKDRKEDSIEVHTYELGAPVTTDPNDVSKFLLKNVENVIYCTYQSLEVIKDACKLNPKFIFDLILFDEAHRTTGSKKKNIFTLAHYDINIPSHKRIYMTATPRVVDVRLKGRLGEEYQELLCDMSNPEIYGQEAHRLSFGEAIEQKILVDYKIIGIGVTDKQIKKFIDDRNYIGELTAEDIAHNFALDLVMNKYNAFHCLSFHSKVASARDFAMRHKELFSEVYSEFVEGNQTTTYRAKVLRRFKNENKAVVANARCLTEGVDVPTIDMIYFCDPKSSKIDIVQATGRALRKDRKENKKERGLIVVPIFHSTDQDIEAEIKKKPIFNYLIQVVRSLCDQDERLEAEINQLAYKKGQRNASRIEIDFLEEETEKVIILEGLEKRIKDNLFDEIIQKTRDYWEVNFKKAEQFRKDYPDRPFPQKFAEDKNFGFWVGNQKKYWHKLSPRRKERLLSIGFNPESSQDVKTDEEWLEIIKEAISDKFKLSAQHRVIFDSKITGETEKIGTYLVGIKAANKDGKKLDVKARIEEAGFSFSSNSRTLENYINNWINDLRKEENPDKINFRNRFNKGILKRLDKTSNEQKEAMKEVWLSKFGSELILGKIQEKTNDRTDEWKAFRYNQDLNPLGKWYQPEKKMGSVFSWVYRKLKSKSQMDTIKHNFTEQEIIELRQEGFPV